MRCYMCHRKPKKLTASRDGEVYVNAENVVMFCSVRCAANYGLLWGVPAIEQDSHFCEVSGEWEVLPKEECNECD